MEKKRRRRYKQKQRANIEMREEERQRDRMARKRKRQELKCAVPKKARLDEINNNVTTHLKRKQRSTNVKETTSFEQTNINSFQIPPLQTNAAKCVYQSHSDHESYADLKSQYEQCKTHFHQKIKEGPSYVCTCCHQTWFKHSVQQLVQLRLGKQASILLSKCSTKFISVEHQEWVCRTCISDIRKGQLPRISIANKVFLPDRPDILQLYELEERLLSPRIPFMQIRELPTGRQFSIKGSVVNVPVDVIPTVTALPRSLTAMQTIPVKLKKRISFSSAVFTQNVRPTVIIEALKWLMKNGPVFNQLGITFDERWIEHFNNAETSDSENCSSFENSTTQTNESEEDSDNFSEIDEAEQRPAIETLLCDAEIDNGQVLAFAPGEDQTPISLYYDSDAEYLAFPTIYCGQRRCSNAERTRPVYYSDFCKFELRCIDRRVARCVPNLFFKLKKIQMQQVTDKVSLALRRCKTKGQKLTASEILNKETVTKLIQLDEGYHIFRSLRNSPPYLEKRKKDLMAMIRQLGFPTYFVSLSAAETRWTDLLRILGKMVDNKEYTEEQLLNADWNLKSRLIQSDPVTCVRFFDHRLQVFINDVLRGSLHPIGVIKDYFLRIEFQQRGSPHAHIMFWIENAPTYNKNPISEIETFVDQYISCSSDVDNESTPMLQLQTHKHSKTCRKRSQAICRFGFPKPPMKFTKLLQPFPVDTDTTLLQQHQQNYEKITALMNSHVDGLDVTFEQFLQQINVTEEEYIQAVCSSLKAPTVFLRRNPSDIRINPYMKNLLQIYGANHDIQYITDPYACAVYIVAYMSKSQRGMSILLDKACKEAKKETSDLRKQVRSIGNKFINAVEVSAQEAVYMLLQLPITRSTRNTLFINTSPPNERTFLLKSTELLEQMDPDDTNIECGNIIERYKRRPRLLRKWCLADYASKLVITYPREDKFWEDEDDFEDDPSCAMTELDGECHLNAEECEIDIKLPNGVHIKSCKSHKVLRFVNYDSTMDPENYFREKIMLYLPWRTEPSDLLGGFHTYEQHFISAKSHIQQKMDFYEPNKTIPQDLLNQARLETIMQRHQITVAPNSQQEEAEDFLKEPNDSMQYSFYKPIRNSHKQSDLSTNVGLSRQAQQTIDLLANRITDQEYYQLVSGLNLKQREFFTHIMQSISCFPDHQIQVFLTGGAGVGKSVLIHALYQALHRFLGDTEGDNPEDQRILLCAPTGKAAFNINGVTIHSAFKINPNQGYNYKKLCADQLNTLRVRYRHLQVVIVDEISMVGNKQLLFMHLRLQEIKQNTKPFGGLHMIAVGDFFQLKPVKDQWIFMHLKQGYGPLTTNLWKEHFQIHELEQIMRQREDLPFAALLNRLREGQHTAEDIKTLQKHIITANSQTYSSLTTHLFPTNALVDHHNSMIYETSTLEKVIINAQDAVIGDMCVTTKTHLQQLIPTDTNKTSGLLKALPIGIEMKYEIVSNISVEDGITNGTTCTVKHIQYLQQSNRTPSIVWVQYAKPQIGRHTRSQYQSYYTDIINSDWTPVFAIQRTFYITSKHIPVCRTQFPLRLATAKTIHKAQGDTLDRIVVHMGNNLVPHAHYVAFSRVTKAEGLQILHLNEGNIKVTATVIEEMKRLRQEKVLQLCYTPLYNLPPESLRVTFQNARSFHKHFNDVTLDSNILASDIISIAESRLTLHDHDDQYTIKEFSIFRNDQHSNNNMQTRMTTMIINILTDPKDRGQNKSCYGIAEDLRIIEITIIQNEEGSSLASKLQKGKFVVLQQYTINNTDDATYLRLINGKSKVFQTGKKFDVPKDILKTFYNPPTCTVPEALASPKKRRLSIDGTVTEMQQTKPTTKDYEIVGVDKEGDNISVITACCKEFAISQTTLQEAGLSVKDVATKPVQATLEIENNVIIKISKTSQKKN
ncbi:ATP-dependent DNA helicase PIF1 [Holothuria leucospilota]|uniref:ATP-dependent DNA helicase n=1 Tax=Holothuria leucospilota TaxID=206669 RepID=A0A9Q0YDS0_HOLLE|nr:ATP-dependent DNA helicase PIF1 [Holothuria leucospilota]